MLGHLWFYGVFFLNFEGHWRAHQKNINSTKDTMERAQAMFTTVQDRWERVWEGLVNVSEISGSEKAERNEGVDLQRDSTFWPQSLHWTVALF